MTNSLNGTSLWNRLMHIESTGFGYLLGWLHCLHLSTLLRRDKMQPSGILLSFYAVSIILWDYESDLKIFIGHCDLYFMVQWFCLIIWRLFHVWTLYFVIMSQCNATFALKQFRTQWLIFSSPEQSSRRAIVQPPASALALASASTNVKVLRSNF